MRTVFGILTGLLTPAVFNLAAGSTLGYIPSPMFWTNIQVAEHIIALLAGSAAGAVAAIGISRRPAMAPVASVVSLITGYEWWKAGDATWIVLGTALSGIVGAGIGSVSWRHLRRPRNTVAA